MGSLVVLENVQWALSLMRLCSSKCVSSSLVVVIVVAVSSGLEHQSMLCLSFAILSIGLLYAVRFFKKLLVSSQQQLWFRLSNKPVSNVLKL